MSDDLGNAKAVQRWAPGTRAVNFLAAGGDVVLTVNPTTLPTMVNGVTARASSDAAFRATLKAAVLRVLTTKATYGLLSSRPQTDGRLGASTVRAVQRWLGRTQTGILDPTTQMPFGFQPVFVRGEAQTNTVARLGESKFAGIGDFHTSLGAEIRFQVPILNVPFRLIYAYNPRARKDQFIDGFPFIFNEQKTTFRFSVGRTF